MIGSLDDRSLELLIRKHALINATRHGGKPEVKAVIGKVVAERSELRAHIKEIMPKVIEICEEVSRMSLEEQEEELRRKHPEAFEVRKKEERKTLPPLPNVDKYKEIRTRFAPNPDSVLHLGSARAIILSHDYARMYDGKFIIRFEDTDPRIKKASLIFYDYIKEDIRWLGCEWDEEYIQSDRLEIYYHFAEELIRRGGGYVCTCKPEEFKKLINESRPCPCRALPPEEHLERWEKMLDGTFKEGDAVFRVKTDLNHPNPAVRDWPAMRIIDPEKHPHPRKGRRYRVWPLYNWAAGIDDHLMGITHIIRGQEHFVNTVRQLYLYEYMGWEYPETIHYGRLMIEGGVLSKSKIERGIQEGRYKGYDDPRLATLRALRRRGVQPEAIRRIIYEVGPKSSDVVISWDNLLAYNRQIIDPIANRYFAIFRPLILIVEGLEGDSLHLELDRHPQARDRPKRKFDLKVDEGKVELLIEEQDAKNMVGREKIRLIGCMNIKNFMMVSGVAYAAFDGFELEKAKKAKAPSIHWLPLDGNLKILVVVEDPDSPIEGIAERGLAEEKVGAMVQLERHFFARVDDKTGDTITLYYTSK
jgi:glutamyl-tRNA synthetase